MGDLKNPNKVSSSSSTSSPISLPPGFRFHPSDHQLCSYYLSHKNNRNPSFSLPPPSSSVNPILVGVDVIQEIDLYNYDPCDLPEFNSYSYGNGGSKKHWYYFTVKGGESEGCRRKAKGGFWKCKGRGKDVRGGGGGGKEGVVVGRKRSFVFFRCNLTRLSSTKWIMVEYSLVDHHVKDPFVLCRVFLKSVGVNKGVENVPSLYAKECIAAKQKICINVPCKQQDAPSTSGIVEVTVLEDTLTDKCNDVEKSPLQLIGVPDDAIMAPVVPDNGLHSSVGVPKSGQPVKFSDWYIGDGVISDDAYTLLTMDGDFLELDDLVCPLLGFESAG